MVLRCWGPYILNFKSNNTVETIFKDYNSLYEKYIQNFAKIYCCYIKMQVILGYVVSWEVTQYP